RLVAIDEGAVEGRAGLDELRWPQAQGPDGVIDDVAAHVAERAGTEVPPAPPAHGGIRGVVRPRAHRTQPEIPVQRTGDRGHLSGPGNPLFPEPAGPVRPDVNLPHLADGASLDPLVGQAGAFGG